MSLASARARVLAVAFAVSATALHAQDKPATAPQPATPQPSAPLPAQPATPRTDFDKKLDDLDAKVAAIADLTADFEQEKRTPLLKKPLTSSGTVKVKGTQTRWDTQKPRPIVMTIDATELKLYYPEQKTLEVYPVAGGMAELAASPLPRSKVVREHFTVTEEPATVIDRGAKDGELGLKLLPLKETLKDHVSQVRVLIDGSTGIARLVEITDADGEVTVMRFTNVKTGTGLKDEQLQLHVPAGTTVSRPLHGEAPKAAEEKK